MRSQLLSVVAVALLIGFAVGTLFANAGPSRPTLAPSSAIQWAEPRPLQPFSGLWSGDQAFRLAQLRENWTIVFYGYTACPDVCPTTLSALGRTVQLLRAQQNPVPSVVFISVDPERDTPAAVAEYARFFDEEFLGVTGDPAAVANFANQMDVMYLPEAADELGRYEVTHSAVLFLVDPAGRLMGGFRPPHLPEELAREIAVLTAAGVVET